MRSYQIRVGSNPKTAVFVKKRKFEHRDRGECQVKTEADIEVMHPHGKECQGLSATTRGGKEESSPIASEGTWS